MDQATVSQPKAAPAKGVARLGLWALAGVLATALVIALLGAAVEIPMIYVLNDKGTPAGFLHLMALSTLVPLAGVAVCIGLCLRALSGFTPKRLLAALAATAILALFVAAAPAARTFVLTGAATILGTGR